MGAAVDTLQHTWVRYTITPVEIEVDAETGKITVLPRPTGPKTHAFGCSRCSLPMHEGISALCEPEGVPE